MIYEILQSGEDEAITNAELSRRLHMSERQIRKHVHNERRDGYPILSGIHGYYLPSSDPEIARHQITLFQNQQRKAGRSHMKTAGTAADILKEIGITV